MCRVRLFVMGWGILSTRGVMHGLCLSVLLIPCLLWADHRPANLIELAGNIHRQLQDKASQLSEPQRQSFYHSLSFIEQQLSNIPKQTQFRLSLSGTTLTVLCRNQIILTWYNHDHHQIRGDIIALLDSNKEFAAVRCDGTRLIWQWYNAADYWFKDNYIGLLDTQGVFEAYALDGTKIIRNWRDTIKVVSEQNYVALLDRFGVLQAYTLTENKRMREVLRVTAVEDIQAIDPQTIRYRTRSGRTHQFTVHQL